MNNKHRIKCKKKTSIKSQCMHAFTQATVMNIMTASYIPLLTVK